MAALPGWKEFSSKLVKWVCLCELYPYRMSLLVLIVLDFEQKAAMNRLVKRREEELKRQYDEMKPRAEDRTSFYRCELRTHIPPQDRDQSSSRPSHT